LVPLALSDGVHAAPPELSNIMHSDEDELIWRCSAPPLLSDKEPAKRTCRSHLPWQFGQRRDVHSIRNDTKVRPTDCSSAARALQRAAARREASRESEAARPPGQRTGARRLRLRVSRPI